MNPNGQPTKTAARRLAEKFAKEKAVVWDEDMVEALEELLLDWSKLHHKIGETLRQQALEKVEERLAELQKEVALLKDNNVK